MVNQKRKSKDNETATGEIKMSACKQAIHKQTFCQVVQVICQKANLPQ